MPKVEPSGKVHGWFLGFGVQSDSNPYYTTETHRHTHPHTHKEGFFLDNEKILEGMRLLFDSTGLEFLRGMQRMPGQLCSTKLVSHLALDSWRGSISKTSIARRNSHNNCWLVGRTKGGLSKSKNDNIFHNRASWLFYVMYSHKRNLPSGNETLFQLSVPKRVCSHLSHFNNQNVPCLGSKFRVHNQLAWVLWPQPRLNFVFGWERPQFLGSFQCSKMNMRHNIFTLISLSGNWLPGKEVLS